MPVLGGIAFITLFFGGLWVAAITINNRADEGSRVANKVFEVGKVGRLADAVAEDGPILFPDLRSPDGVRSVVLDHTGTDPARGWQAYYAYPADRDATCLVTHVQGTRSFTDCDGRTLGTDDLTASAHVRPIVENKRTLYLDLRGITSDTAD